MTDLQARFARADEVERWDILVAANPTGGDFVQTKPYAATKATVGWTPRYLVFEAAGAPVSVALVLERRIPLLGRYWYLPHGPAVAEPASTHAHVVALRKFALQQPGRIFAITIDPMLEDTEQNRLATTAGPYALTALGARWRPGIQGNTFTAIVSLDGSDAELLARFHKRCRNMINRALRDGVEVREYPANAETFAHMHRLMRLVGGGGAALRLRSESYAETFWRGFSDAGLGRFYGIEVDGTPALLAFVIRVGECAFYKDGGSERHRTTPGMSNLLQWRMMRDMRDAGARSYDMLGVPPRARLDDPTAPNHSLAPFKLSFAREVTEFIGAYDVVLRPGAFTWWQRFGLPITQRLHRRRYRDLDLY